QVAVRWGMYGIGWHAGLLMAPALRRAQNTELRAVCSRDMGRAKEFAGRFEVPMAYDSYDAMLADGDIDAVYLATPNNLHREHTEKAAAAGKHVLVEKPMALTEADCQAMIEACQRAKVRLGVCFQNRHHPAHMEARRMVLGGEVGEVLRASAEFSVNPPRMPWKEWRWDLTQAGGAAIMAIGVHAFDLLRFVLGREALAVAAFSDEESSNRHVDEIMTCAFRFQGGTQALALYGLHIPDARNNLDIHGSQAHVVGVGTIGAVYRGTLTVSRGDVRTEVAYPHLHPETGMFERLIESFNESVVEGKEPSATGYDGLEVCRMTTAALASAREGRVVAIRPA
ncbi:MAG: Gfo/Idh/MocA family protein, partial [Dehalococcoidia bacterium]